MSNAPRPARRRSISSPLPHATACKSLTWVTVQGLRPTVSRFLANCPHADPWIRVLRTTSLIPETSSVYAVNAKAFRKLLAFSGRSSRLL